MKNGKNQIRSDAATPSPPNRNDQRPSEASETQNLLKVEDELIQHLTRGGKIL
jgi:hypothetical protein